VVAGITAHAMAMPPQQQRCLHESAVRVGVEERERHGRDDRSNAAIDTDDAAAEAIDEAAAGW
jgi:hypothetical protein